MTTLAATDPAIIRAVVLSAILGCTFLAMATDFMPQTLAMPLAACALLALYPSRALDALEDSFHDFGRLALLFTAVAVPAHQVQRSYAFEWAGKLLGKYIGIFTINREYLRVPYTSFALLLMTYVTAALFHNITSILVMVPIAISICDLYKIESQYILCGLLVASNLGGFSSSWGDTPNIVETAVWNLINTNFTTEIVPINVSILVILAVGVTCLTRPTQMGKFSSVVAIADLVQELRNVNVNVKLLILGVGTLFGFIILQYILPEYEIAAAAATILVAVTLDRQADRDQSLHSLDFDVYMVLAAIFVMARIIDQSTIGERLEFFLKSTDGALWAIAAAAYFGTMVTEAASFASVVAKMVHQLNPSHAGAWALGGGICAGSSALLTSASAGIILLTESRKFKGNEITFKTYMGFGLGASLLMLAFYIACFSWFF